jgi:hypothetical protein
MRTIVRIVLVLGVVSASFGSAQAGNLLTNPGAEDGNLTGWTVGGTSNPGVDSGTFDPGINPHSGSYDFYGHTGAEGTLTQNVSLIGLPGISTGLIDAGLTTANISFWEQGLNQGTPSDDAKITLTFLNGSNAAISSVSTPEVDSHNGTWEQYTASYVIPVGTRSIDYTMDFIRHVGSDLDAFVDDNSLIVSSSVPEPSTFVLMGVGVLALVGCGWRRRQLGSRA